MLGDGGDGQKVSNSHLGGVAWVRLQSFRLRCSMEPDGYAPRRQAGDPKEFVLRCVSSLADLILRERDLSYANPDHLLARQTSQSPYLSASLIITAKKQRN